MQIIGTWLTEKGAKIGRTGLFAALLIATTAILAVAQNQCIDPLKKGEFTVDKVRVCAGTPVTVTAPPNMASVGYNFQYDGNGFPKTTVSPTPPSTSYTYAGYTTPGSYTIIQQGSGGGEGSVACKTVEVVPKGEVRATARSCANLTVALSALLDNSNNKYDAYIIDWGERPDKVIERFTLAQLQNRPRHTYPDGRSRIASIQGVYDAPTSCSGPVYTFSITPLATATATTPPFIRELKTIDDNNITLSYQAANSTSIIQLQQKDPSGAYTPTSQTGISGGTFTVQTNTKQTQCFKLTSQDECGTTGPTSEEVCSIALTATATSKKNNLSWNAYQGSIPFKSYRIYRNGSPFTLIPTKAQTSASDESDIQCGVQYCYTIEATLAGIGETKVISAPTCVTGVNTEAPDSFTNVLVSVESDKPQLIAIPPVSAGTSYTGIVSRSSGGPFQQVGILAGNSFVDESADVNAGSYCYQVAYQNTCGQVSAPSPTVCTVWLSSKTPGGIDWTRDSPFSSGEVGSYEVEVVNADNGTQEYIPAGTKIRYEPDPNDPVTSVQRYRIVAVSADGFQSYSNFYKLIRQTPLFVPDAFSPNGDQANDVFLVKGATSDQFRLTIYSRWGQVVFSSTSISQGWDGTINGQPAIEGQYMYRIEVEDPDGNKTVRTGAVLLLR